MNKELWEELNVAESLALASKWERFYHAPIKYMWAFTFRRCIYPFTRKEQLLTAHTFFGKKIMISLPASTDIYLTGSKSHHSEIRLARFLLLNLAKGDTFIDIGAHYGYFSLLAATITGDQGRVISLEPSPSNFSLLKKNIADLPNINAIQKAVSCNEGELVFYEFPALYSEYNTIDTTQFEDKSWFNAYKPVKHLLKATTIDIIAQHLSDKASLMIKVDVEGAELDVIRGGSRTLSKKNLTLIMEYLAPGRKNESHRAATALLKQMGYRPYLINNQGQLNAADDIDEYLTSQYLDSENIVFKKN
jgi:FkbM family methyltransferase